MVEIIGVCVDCGVRVEGPSKLSKSALCGVCYGRRMKEMREEGERRREEETSSEGG